jgi:rhodanese-related sulfurtransferase
MKIRSFSFLLPVFILFACGNVGAPEEQSEGSSIEASLQEGTHENVNVEQFAQLMENELAFVLDVRTPEEWDAGFIAGAHFMNYYDDDFQERLGKLNKEVPVLVYCKVGGRSGSAMDMMKGMGFTEVYNLNGGFDAWSAQGMPVEK